METSKKEFNVRVVLLRENDGWAAQCLEYDIVAQGRTLDVVKDRLGRTLIGQIIVDLENGREPLAGIRQAPREYWEHFEMGQRLERQPPFYIPENLPIPFRAAAEDMRVYA